MITSILRRLPKSSSTTFKGLKKLPSSGHQALLPLLFALGQKNSKMFTSPNMLQFSTFRTKLGSTIQDELAELQYNLTEYGERHEVVVDCYVKLANAYDRNKQHEKALECHTKALQINISLYGSDHEAVAESYLNVGLCYFYLGQNESALSNYQQAFQIFEKVLDKEDDFKLGTCYDSMGTVYCSDGRYKEGLNCYDKALKIYEKNRKENEIDILTLYNQMVIVYNKQNMKDKVIACLQEIAKINVSIFGEKHLNVADAYFNLGNAYQNKKDIKGAAKHYQLAMPIYKGTLGENNPKFLKCIQKIGLMLIEERAFDRAFEIFTQAQNIIK